MIIIAGEIKISAADAEAFADEVRRLQTATRKEEGCVWYAFTRDLDDDTAFRISEKWASEEALALHLETPHVKSLVTALKTLSVESMTAFKYPVTEEINMLA